MSKEQDARLKQWAIRRAAIVKAYRKLSYEKVGKIYGISRERVRQIVQAAK